MSYRDLLAEAARRRDAETRAQKAEAKLASVRRLLDLVDEHNASMETDWRVLGTDEVRTILDGKNA